MHDVWPGNFSRVDRELQWLRERGAMNTALFVVPCYHGTRPIEEEPAFLEWIRLQQNMGCEIFAHGFRHVCGERRGETVRRNAYGRWLNRGLNGEGEFAGLAEADQNKLMERAALHFRKALLEPVGWAFPAWFGSAPPTGFGSALRFIDGRFFVRDGLSLRKLWIPALTFGRVKDSERRFLYGGEFGSMLLNLHATIRISLHPGDLESRAVNHRVDAWLRRGTGVSYSALFASAQGR